MAAAAPPAAAPPGSPEALIVRARPGYYYADGLMYIPGRRQPGGKASTAVDAPSSTDARGGGSLRHRECERTRSG